MTSLQDKLNQLAEDGPIAIRKRSLQIAEMDELTLDEFRELTGVGIGTLGIYQISETEVTVVGSVKMADLSGSDRAERQGSLWNRHIHRNFGSYR